ncbi:unnamed protein product [Caenorhabditis brenneri]
MTHAEAFQLAMNFVQDEFGKHPNEFISLGNIWGDIEEFLVDGGFEENFFQLKDFCTYLWKQTPDKKSQQLRVNAIYRLQLSVPKFFHKHFINLGSAVFNSKGCIVEYLDGLLILGEPHDAVISKFLVSNLTKIEGMNTREEMILAFIESRKNFGPKDKQYLAERFDQVSLKLRTNRRISEKNRDRIQQIMRFFARNEAATSSDSLTAIDVALPPEFCYPSLENHHLNKYELSDYLCFLESFSLQTISPVTHAETASAYKEFRKNADFRVENISQKISVFNEAISEVSEFSRVSIIRMLFITQTPCIFSISDLGYKGNELLLDKTNRVVMFRPKNVNVYLERESFSKNRTCEQINLNPLPWSVQEVDDLFQFIRVESEGTDDHLNLTLLCRSYMTSRNTNRRIEQLYSKAYEYLSTEYYDMGRGINFTQKLSILYKLKIMLNTSFINNCLKTRAIFQLSRRKELVFASCSGTLIGKFDEKESTNLTLIQLNLLEIIRCLSLRTMKILSNAKIVQVYRTANPGLLFQSPILHETINIVRNLFESFNECSLFSRMHMLYVTQTDVSNEFKQQLNRFDVNFVLKKITGYTADHICVNFDRMNSSWIEEVETTDSNHSTKERQVNPMFDILYFPRNNINQEIMECLKILGKISLGTFTNEQIFEVLQNKTAGIYNRREFNDAIEQFKSNIELSDHLGPFTQLRLLFMTRSPVSETFLQKWAQKYDIQVDNQNVILKFKAVVCLILNRNDGIRMEEYKSQEPVLSPSASNSVIHSEDVHHEQSFDDHMGETRPVTEDIKPEQPEGSDQQSQISPQNSHQSGTDQNIRRVSPEKQHPRPAEPSANVSELLGKHKTRRDEIRRPDVEVIKAEEPDDYATTAANSTTNSASPGTSSSQNPFERYGPTGLNTAKYLSLKRCGSSNNQVEAKKLRSGPSNQESRQTISEEEGINSDEQTSNQSSQLTSTSEDPTSSTAPLPHTSAKNILLTLRTSVAVLRMTEFSEFEDRITETIGNIKEDNVPIETVISTLGRTLSMVAYPLKMTKKESDSMLVSKALNVLIHVSFGLKPHFANFPALSAIVAEIEKAEKSVEGSDKRISIEEVKLALQNWIMVLGDSS